jgi:hypothetical protein
MIIQSRKLGDAIVSAGSLIPTNMASAFTCALFDIVVTHIIHHVYLLEGILTLSEA